MQQHASVYLLRNYSTCFGCPSHPSSGVHQTVTAAAGTGHAGKSLLDLVGSFSVYSYQSYHFNNHLLALKNASVLLYTIYYILYTTHNYVLYKT